MEKPFDPKGSGPRMDDNFDKAAIAVIIVFGALIIGGLMAANLVMGHRILFDLPRAYAFMVAASFLLAFASTLSLVT